MLDCVPFGVNTDLLFWCVFASCLLGTAVWASWGRPEHLFENTFYFTSKVANSCLLLLMFYIFQSWLLAWYDSWPLSITGTSIDRKKCHFHFCAFSEQMGNASVDIIFLAWRVLDPSLNFCQTCIHFPARHNFPKFRVLIIPILPPLPRTHIHFYELWFR